MLLILVVEVCDYITKTVLITLLLTVCRFSTSNRQITDRHGWPEAHGDHGEETAGRKKQSLATLSAHFTLQVIPLISYQ